MNTKGKLEDWWPDNFSLLRLYAFEGKNDLVSLSLIKLNILNKNTHVSFLNVKLIFNGSIYFYTL